MMPAMHCALPAALFVSFALAAQEFQIREVLAVPSTGTTHRSPVVQDAVLAQRALGTWTMPAPSAALVVPGGKTQQWTVVRAREDGWFEDPALRQGVALATLTLPEPQVLLLEARSHAAVYVNDVPRAGDPYDHGWLRLPVALDAGANTLLFRTRGRLWARLVPPPAPVFLDLADATVPDLLVDRPGPWHLAFVVVNATNAWQPELVLAARTAGGSWHTTAMAALPPCSTRKIAVSLFVKADAAGELDLELVLRRGAAPLHTAATRLAVRQPGERHRRTFISAIDGSVQKFAVVPALPPPDRPPAMVLTLHGAGVDADGQAACYAPRPDCCIVAPTNRRPFGFDWEDWGRLDALEVLDHAQSLLATDPQRTTLTGHSMGGHGTWQLGAHFPDRFAALAPSAGWREFASYGGTSGLGDAPVERLLARAANPSRTLLLKDNYRDLGVYVLHGDADDNVPVTEARAMRAELGAFHRDFAYYERPGAGHWWGNECVDWPPLLRFLLDHQRPAPRDVRRVRFTTVNPGLSGRCDWLTVAAQLRWLEPTRVEAVLEPAAASLQITTENAARLTLDLSRFTTPDSAGHRLLDPAHPLAITCDGTALTSGLGSAKVHLLRSGPAWELATEPAPRAKGPHRCGPFKDAFRHRMLFVVATAGDADEDAWAMAKARFDAETFWYRGNGATEIVLDVDFDPAADPDRNVILYGNHDTNAAWDQVLTDCPIDVRRGVVRVGERELLGDDLACLFVFPRTASPTASVGVIAPTGGPGARTADVLPVFLSGVAYPDWSVFGADLLARGAAGIRGAGFFGTDWTVETGELAWR